MATAASSTIQSVRMSNRTVSTTALSAGPPIQTFDRAGELGTSSSHIYWLPYSPASSIFAGGVTVYTSGTVSVDLLRNFSVVATLTVSDTGLFVVPASIAWQTGDSMFVIITDPGIGNYGFTAVVM